MEEVEGVDGVERVEVEVAPEAAASRGAMAGAGRRRGPRQAASAPGQEAAKWLPPGAGGGWFGRCGHVRRGSHGKAGEDRGRRRGILAR